MTDPRNEVKTLELAFMNLPEEASKETPQEYVQAIGVITRFHAVSGKAEVKPFCFVRFKE